MTAWTRRSFLAAAAALSVSPVRAAGRVQREITIASAPLAQLGTYGLGIRLGATEAERAAMLLGHRFALVHDGAASARVELDAPESSDVPVVARNGTSRSACVFVTASDPVATSEDGEVVDWHPEFRRYGAGELNERFERAFGTPMTADAWHGWVAVKAIVEAAIRGDALCAELARLRFDGHKGRVLTFDRETRRLRHPALVVRAKGGKNIVEVLP